VRGRKRIQLLAAVADGASAPGILVPALGALGRLKAGGPTAAKHAGHADPKVALAAVTALGQIGGEPAIQALTAAVEDPRLDVRKAAIAALGTLAAKPA